MLFSFFKVLQLKIGSYPNLNLKYQVQLNIIILCRGSYNLSILIRNIFARLIYFLYLQIVNSFKQKNCPGSPFLLDRRKNSPMQDIQLIIVIAEVSHHKSEVLASIHSVEISTKSKINDIYLWPLSPIDKRYKYLQTL